MVEYCSAVYEHPDNKNLRVASRRASAHMLCLNLVPCFVMYGSTFARSVWKLFISILIYWIKLTSGLSWSSRYIVAWLPNFPLLLNHSLHRTRLWSLACFCFFIHTPRISPHKAIFFLSTVLGRVRQIPHSTLQQGQSETEPRACIWHHSWVYNFARQSLPGEGVDVVG